MSARSHVELDRVVPPLAVLGALHLDHARIAAAFCLKLPATFGQGHGRAGTPLPLAMLITDCPISSSSAPRVSLRGLVALCRGWRKTTRGSIS